jgi:hypothetical protein
MEMGKEFEYESAFAFVFEGEYSSLRDENPEEAQKRFSAASEKIEERWAELKEMAAPVESGDWFGGTVKDPKTFTGVRDLADTYHALENALEHVPFDCKLREVIEAAQKDLYDRLQRFYTDAADPKAAAKRKRLQRQAG